MMEDVQDGATPTHSALLVLQVPSSNRAEAISKGCALCCAQPRLAEQSLCVSCGMACREWLVAPFASRWLGIIFSARASTQEQSARAMRSSHGVV